MPAGPDSRSRCPPWKYCGSFSLPSPFTDAFPPEQRISLDTSYGGKRWFTRHEWVDGVIQDLGPDTMCAHYLCRTLTSPRDTMVTVSLGSDDGINVWVNGTKLISKDESRAAGADQEILTVALKKGDNAFLMKVNNGYGPSGFYFALYDNDLRELMGLVRRDFPDEASVREMAWEEADTIWSGPWIPGDMQALALKYAAHAPCTTKDEQDALTARAAAVTSAEELTAVRTHYVNSRVSELVPIILTPKPPATPRINGARRVGARPGSPFLHIVPVTGDRPMKISASGLPRGLALDGATGIITGTAKNAGTYHVRVTATNARGTARSTLTIVIGKTIALTPRSDGTAGTVSRPRWTTGVFAPPPKQWSPPDLRSTAGAISTSTIAGRSNRGVPIHWSVANPGSPTARSIRTRNSRTCTRSARTSMQRD
ncbi:MAG: putative Ig domain-containing protein [Ignavibacteriae bacterium]|nr:putative Ig domain-containing protein [Ignavibacteriota bacterium]